VVTHLRVPALHLLSLGHSALTIRVNEIPNKSIESGFEYDAGQRQECELAVVPAGHTANVDVRVAGKFAELELLAARRGDRADTIHSQGGVFVASGDLHFVPVAIAQVMTDRDDLRAAAEVVPEPERALDQLHLEEIIGAAVIRVQQQPVTLLGLELEFQGAIQTGVPFAELCVAGRRALQHEGTCHLAGEQGRQEERRQRRERAAMHDSVSEQSLFIRQFAFVVSRAVRVRADRHARLTRIPRRSSRGCVELATLLSRHPAASAWATWPRTRADRACSGCVRGGTWVRDRVRASPSPPVKVQAPRLLLLGVTKGDPRCSDSR